MRQAKAETESAKKELARAQDQLAKERQELADTRHRLNKARQQLAENASAKPQSVKPASPAQVVIGTWLDETIGLPRRLTILRKGRNVFIEDRYNDNSGGTTEVTETKSLDGLRFDYASAPGRSQGGYFLINSAGELEEWVKFKPGDLIPSDVETSGEYGLYTRARRVQHAKRS